MLGSQTNAESWEKYDVDQLTNIHLEHQYQLGAAEKGRLSKLSGRLWAAEKEMYQPLVTCLSSLIPVTQAVVWNTSATHYLDGMAPDITVSLTGTDNVEASFAHGVIELKPQNEKLDTDSHLGQLATYLGRLHKVRLERTHFWGVLSNLKDNFLLTITFDNNFTAVRQRVEKSPSLNLEQIVQYIRGRISEQAASHSIPHRLPFPAGAGRLHRRLATNSKWMVGQFPISGSQGKGGSYMVVKSSLPRGEHHHVLNHHVNELLQLRRLKAIRPPPPTSIAQLLWEPTDQEKGDLESIDTWPHIDFGIIPYGVPLEMSNFTTPEDCGSILKSILNGLQWLHAHARTIHRDLRPDNVIHDNIKGTAVIIDFDCAWSLPSGESDFGRAETNYNGGVICAPRRVLDSFGKAMTKLPASTDITEPQAVCAAQRSLTEVVYNPVPADDLCAFVLLVLALLYPAGFAGFKQYKIFDPTSQSALRGLERLFASVGNSRTCGPWWKLAENGDMSGLREMTDSVLWPFIDMALGEGGSGMGEIL